MKIFRKCNCKQILYILTCVYISLIFSVFLLIEYNGYADIMYAKSLFFWEVTSGYLLVAALLIAIEMIRTKESIHLRDMDATDYLVLVFAIVIFISFLTSPDKYASFWGIEGRMCGVFTLLECCGLYYVIRHRSKIGINKDGTGVKIVVTVMVLSLSFVFIIGIFNHIGFNPFGLCSTYEYQRSRFISTYGNRNTFASLALLSCSISAPMFVLSNIKFTRHISAIFTYISLMAIYASVSDGALLGLFVLTIILLFYVLKDVKLLAGFWEFVLLIGLSAAADFVLRTIAQDRAWIVTGILKIIYKYNIEYVLIAVSILGIIICRYMIRQGNNKIKPFVRKAVFIIIGVCIVTGIISLIFINGFMSEDQIGKTFGALADYIVFSEKWGTNRGGIWIGAIAVFTAMPFVSKIFV